jgi:hypothetical protein
LSLLAAFDRLHIIVSATSGFQFALFRLANALLMTCLSHSTSIMSSLFVPLLSLLVLLFVRLFRRCRWPIFTLFLLCFWYKLLFKHFGRISFARFAPPLTTFEPIQSERKPFTLL